MFDARNPRQPEQLSNSLFQKTAAKTKSTEQSSKSWRPITHAGLRQDQPENTVPELSHSNQLLRLQDREVPRASQTIRLLGRGFPLTVASWVLNKHCSPWAAFSLPPGEEVPPDLSFLHLDSCFSLSSTTPWSFHSYARPGKIPFKLISKFSKLAGQKINTETAIAFQSLMISLLQNKSSKQSPV